MHIVLVRAEMEGDWPLHVLLKKCYQISLHLVMSTMYNMVYTTLQSMQRLHPSLLKKFMAGEHVMHHQNVF